MPAALLLALGAAILSGLAYSGENGYSLTQNYFSDLGVTVTRDGDENFVGALLFLGSCGAFGYAVWRFARLAVFAPGRDRYTPSDDNPGGWDANPGGPDEISSGAVNSPDARDAAAGREETAGDAPGRSRSQAANRVFDRMPRSSWSGPKVSRRGLLSAGAEGTILSRLGKAGVLLGGLLAAVFFLLTGLTPKNQLFHLHNWVSYSAFLALLLLWISAAILGPPGWPRGNHVSMVLLSAGYLAVLFSRPSWSMPDGWALQVVAQKIVVIGNWVGVFFSSFFLGRAIVSRET